MLKYLSIIPDFFGKALIGIEKCEIQGILTGFDNFCKIKLQHI